MSTNDSDVFLEHLARLLAAYEMGPQQGGQVPAFSPALESQESILSSLERVAKRMWNAVTELEDKRHDGGRDQEKEVEEKKERKDEEKVKEEGWVLTSPVPETATIAENRSLDALLTADTSTSSDEELKLLKSQIKDVTRVCNAIIAGDLTQSVTVDAQGEMLELQTTVNAMTTQLAFFASQAETATRDAVTKLGVQAEVGNTEGVWKDIIVYANTMARNHTNQARCLAKLGSAAMFDDYLGLDMFLSGDVGLIFNTVHAMKHVLVSKTTALEAAETANKDMSELFYDVARVCNAIISGDLNQSVTVTVSADGPLLYLKDTVNDMTRHLRHLANEVSRVSLDVVVDGGQGQAGDGLGAGIFDDGGVDVPDAEGVWLEMVRNVNRLCLAFKDQSEVVRGRMIGT